MSLLVPTSLQIQWLAQQHLENLQWKKKAWLSWLGWSPEFYKENGFYSTYPDFRIFQAVQWREIISSVFLCNESRRLLVSPYRGGDGAQSWFTAVGIDKIFLKAAKRKMRSLYISVKWAVDRRGLIHDSSPVKCGHLSHKICRWKRPLQRT